VGAQFKGLKMTRSVPARAAFSSIPGIVVPTPHSGPHHTRKGPVTRAEISRLFAAELGYGAADLRLA
jgi:hypothetical protein